MFLQRPVDTIIILVTLFCMMFWVNLQFDYIERELEIIKIEIKQIYNDLIFEE